MPRPSFCCPAANPNRVDLKFAGGVVAAVQQAATEMQDRKYLAEKKVEGFRKYLLSSLVVGQNQGKAPFFFNLSSKVLILMSLVHRAAEFVKSWYPAILSSDPARRRGSRRRPAATKFRFESLERRTMFAAGDIDTTFSDDGYARFTDGYVSTSGNAVAVQSDGKIVIAGSSLNNAAVVRFTSSGALDNTFNVVGSSLINFGGEDWNNHATDVVIQPDGKILVAGYREFYELSRSDFFVARLTTDGTLDTSFSGDGRRLINVRKFDFEPRIALQSDGKIVLAGSTSTEEDSATEDVALVRLKSNGELDTSFSLDGKLAVDTGGVDKEDRVSALTISSNGKYIVGGSTVASASHDWQINWFHSSGNLYRTKRITHGGDDELEDLVMASNGVITAVGWSMQGGRYIPALARLTSTGIYDESFDGDSNGNGRFLLDYNSPDSARAESVALLPGGKILIGGHADYFGDSDMALIRLNANGALDGTFDDNGYAYYNFPTTAGGGNPYDYMSDMVVAGGKLIAVGWTESRMGVMRVLL